MDVAQSAQEISPLLRKRLGLDEATAKDMAEKYLLAVMDQAIVNIHSEAMAPTAMSANRVQLVELISHRLQRLPSARELTALLRLPESTARGLLRNVLSMSDRANDVALKSIFNRAKRTGSVGTKGDPPNGNIWRLGSATDLEFARDLLEARNIPFTTRQEVDAQYVLVIDRAFDPSKL